MERVKIATLLVLLIAAQMMPHAMSFPTTSPAFLWSPHGYGSSTFDVKEFVNYQTLSPKDLAKSVLSEGGWSNFLCSSNELHQNVDVALVYVGRELQLSDLSRDEHKDPTLLSLLKNSFTSSNISVAFPYVTVSDGKNTFENSLITGLTENCGNELGENLKRLKGPQELQDFVSSRMEASENVKTDLIVYSDEDFLELDQAKSEGKTLSALVNYFENSGATYTILYASDPYKSLPYPHLAMRFLGEDNSSTGSIVCDGVCQFKSSLLEGLFVGIVLLVILISGLCCMMGIDTPTRFETPQES